MVCLTSQAILAKERAGDVNTSPGDEEPGLQLRGSFTREAGGVAWVVAFDGTQPGDQGAAPTGDSTIASGRDRLQAD
jgi:hypothetical protein